MPHSFDYSEKLKKIIERLKNRDAKRAEILYNKINQIINSDEQTIEHYKNLRHGWSDKKRVHIDKSFVLTFQYNKKTKFLLFLDFDHHDNIYNK